MRVSFTADDSERGARVAHSPARKPMDSCHYPLSATVLRSLDAVSSLSLYDPLLKTIRRWPESPSRRTRFTRSFVIPFGGYDSGARILSCYSRYFSTHPRPREMKGEKKEVRFVEKRINGTRTRSGNGARYVVVVALTQFLCYFPPLPSLRSLPLSPPLRLFRSQVERG